MFRHSGAALPQEWTVAAERAMLDRVRLAYTLAYCLVKESDFQLALSLRAAEVEQERIESRLRAFVATKDGEHGAGN